MTIGDPENVVSGRWLAKAVAIVLAIAAVCVYVLFRVLMHMGHVPAGR